MKRRGDNVSLVLSIRLPEELAKELDQIAAETERPRSFHVHKAIEKELR
jgi:predicted transcriptional regulator